jgi:hypothetical protein
VVVGDSECGGGKQGLEAVARSDGGGGEQGLEKFSCPAFYPLPTSCPLSTQLIVLCAALYVEGCRRSVLDMADGGLEGPL